MLSCGHRRLNSAPTYDGIMRNRRVLATPRGSLCLLSLPIEARILKSIERVCKKSRIDIKDVDPKYRDWGGGVRNRLEALGEKDMYVTQRIGSHAIHGTWIDLLFHNLEEKEGGFVVNPAWSRVDSRLMLPICFLLLKAAESYVQFFFPENPGVRPLLRRITSLHDRIRRTDDAAESWLVANRQATTNANTEDSPSA